MRKAALLLLAFTAGLFAQGPSHGVTLAWAWAQGTGGTCAGFNVKRATVAGGPYTTVSTVASCATTSYADNSGTGNVLTEGTKYYYVITATGPGGESAPSNEANASIPFSVPALPSGLSATAH
jgi:hypothetical protein